MILVVLDNQNTKNDVTKICDEPGKGPLFKNEGPKTNRHTPSRDVFREDPGLKFIFFALSGRKNQSRFECQPIRKQYSKKMTFKVCSFLGCFHEMFLLGFFYYCSVIYV